MRGPSVNLRTILSGILIAGLVAACGSEETTTITPIDPPRPPDKITPVSTDHHLVYLAVSESIDGIWVPKQINPDGTVVHLTDGKREGQAEALYVDAQQNTYIAGWHTTSKRADYAVYWKNAVPVLLTDTLNDASSSATDIVVVGEDVYVAGSVGSQAVYWKNGVRVNMSDGKLPVITFGICVSGNDVFVAGGTRNSITEKYEACYWKNGTEIKLLQSESAATAILVQGSDLYITGSFGTGKYWKNGSFHKLEATYGGTGDILLADGKVYITGVGRYWKDGVAVDMMATPTSPNISCIAVLDDVVYVGGFQHLDGFNTPRIWKNGAAFTVNDGKHHGGVADIVVITK